MLQTLLNDRELLPDAEPARPHETLYRNRPVCVQSLFGPIQLTRRYYHHKHVGHGRSPLDEQLDLVRGHTPCLTKLICRAAACAGSYAEAASDLNAYSGLQLNARSFPRLMGEAAPQLKEALASLPAASPPTPVEVLYVSSDGTGVPMRREQLKGVKGKQADGSAHTREVKLGCVFTQTKTNKEGEPERDPDSTSYVGTLGDCRVAGVLLHQEAHRRGYGSAKQVVYIGDGAAWVWENARLNFPQAEQVLDFYHASEHLGELSAALHGRGSEQAKEQQSKWCHQLKASDSSQIVAQAEAMLKELQIQKPDESQRQAAQSQIDYLKSHAQRMRYGYYRQQGWFIGSGVVEAGCKSIVGRRLKQSGMFWGERGGADMLELRCLIKGPHFESAWKARLPILAKQRKKAMQWAHPSTIAA